MKQTPRSRGFHQNWVSLVENQNITFRNLLGNLQPTRSTAITGDRLLYLALDTQATNPGTVLEAGWLGLKRFLSASQSLKADRKCIHPLPHACDRLILSFVLRSLFLQFSFIDMLIEQQYKQQDDFVTATMDSSPGFHGLRRRHECYHGTHRPNDHTRFNLRQSHHQMATSSLIWKATSTTSICTGAALS